MSFEGVVSYYRADSAPLSSPRIGRLSEPEHRQPNCGPLAMSERDQRLLNALEGLGMHP
ncbi:MAG: hypothetical protein ACJAZN_000963 [Planctomycetota bacterium]|jgi:hypothetical protein